MIDSEIEGAFRLFVQNYLQNEKFSTMYFGVHYNKYLFLLKHDRTFILVFDISLHSLDFIDEVYSDKKNLTNKAQIVGCKNDILLLDGEGDLYRFVNKDKGCFNNCCARGYKWVKFEDFNFRKVFAITANEDGFACIGADKNGRKMFKIFEMWAVLTFKDYTFCDLDSTQTDNYYLSAVDSETSGFSEYIVSDKFSGRTYLVSSGAQSSVIHYSDLQLTSSILFEQDRCLLLCYENGKLVFHFLSDSSLNYVLFLRKKITCIVKSFCCNSCVLWSDGVNLYHTFINLTDETMTTFKVDCKIKGIIFLMISKELGIVIAVTINNMYYKIKVPLNFSEKLVQSSCEILSQIHNECLKLNDLQKNLKTVSEYLSFKEMIQNKQLKLELNQAENFLSIKNLTKVVFEKKFWKLKLKICIHGCDQVKLVELETDLLKGMMLKIQNPFGNTERVTVYFLGTFEWEILCFCIGIIGEKDDSRKENLKKKLEEIALQKNLNN